MKKGILDASALLAFIHNDAGSDTTREWMHGGTMSTINYAEVLQQLTVNSSERQMVDAIIGSFGIKLVDFDKEQACSAAAILPFTTQGNSIAGRACLALGQSLGMPIITGDRSWQSMDLDVDVVFIRPQAN